MRIRAANRATAIAEYFRSQSKNVLLIMDSLTRIAHAKREIGLSLGEPTTSKGYPASVISMIPNLIERSGTNDEGDGSITSFYTILADGDDNNDPVVDTARAILDGHILLSRSNAQMGIYPAIDVSNSISRVMNDLASDEHLNAAKLFRKHISSYIENKDLLLMGGYTQGQDKDLDEAILMWPKLIDYISQTNSEKSDYETSKTQLLKLYSENYFGKKIRRFQRLATLRKRDISKNVANSNLLETEIIKNKKLINQIDDIMNNSKIDGTQKIINSGFFKNNAQLLTTLQSQKNIATNRNNYLLNEQKLVKKKIIINSLKKIKADEKTSEYKTLYSQELEKKNYN